MYLLAPVPERRPRRRSLGAVPAPVIVVDPTNNQPPRTQDATPMPTVVFPTSDNAPVDQGFNKLYWPCKPGGAFSGETLQRGTRYRFIVYATSNTPKNVVEIGVGNAGFYSGDLTVSSCGCGSWPSSGFQPCGWTANDPQTLLWQDVPGMTAWCIEATYIGPSDSSQTVLCARPVGCWPGWGSAPPCRDPNPLPGASGSDDHGGGGSGGEGDVPPLPSPNAGDRGGDAVPAGAGNGVRAVLVGLGLVGVLGYLLVAR